MTINYTAIMDRRFEAVRQKYLARDTITYNLGIGAGVIANASDVQLSRVWEKTLVASPTMVAVLANETYWYDDPGLGLNWRNSVHGEQSITWHAAIDPEGEVIGRAAVESVFKAGRGVIVVLRRELTDARTDTAIATIRQSIYFRDNGGFGESNTTARPSPVPEGAPDTVSKLTTRPEQALLYRLSGDSFPLHIDPEFAHAAGFPAPPLHGLCTYAIGGHAIIEHLCGGVASRLEQLDGRFSAPVYPGETIETRIWQIGDGQAAWRCVVEGRTVIDKGLARFRTGAQNELPPASPLRQG